MVQFKVIDRKGQELCAKQEASNDSTVDDLRKLILKANASLSKKIGHDVNRMRLTVGDAKGRALADKR